MNARAILRAMREHVPGLFERPGTVLYVGACARHFTGGKALWEAGNEITVLEAWAPALERLLRHRIGRYVARGVVGMVQDVTAKALPRNRYDYAVWSHGPEHLGKEAALEALTRLEALAGAVFVACPWGWQRNPQFGGNPFTRHRSAWEPEEFAALGYETATAGRQGRGEVFAWKKQ